MKRIAFKMILFAGQEDEYRRRHDEIWPELKALLKDAGVEDYSISLDAETNTLFASMKIADPQQLDELALQPVMKKWWSFMSDVMESTADGPPVTKPLTELFYLP